MNELLDYINKNNIINDKNISRSHERKLLKTFDFYNDDNNISGVLNYIWNQKKYEVLICYDNNVKVEKVIYKVFDVKDDAFAFYEKICNFLLSIFGEN